MPAAKKKPAAPNRKTAEQQGPGRQGRSVKRNGNGLTPHAEIPKGPKMDAAQQALRDTMMLQRKAQGWTIEEIAKEAGLSVSGAKKALRKKKEAMPPTLGRDPLEIVAELVEAYDADIGDLERMAAAYAERQPSVAVGAKKAAGSMRWQKTILLQATGQLPRELGTLRVVAEARVVAAVLYDSVEQMEERLKTALEKLDLPAAKKKELLAATGTVRGALEDISGTATER